MARKKNNKSRSGRSEITGKGKAEFTDENGNRRVINFGLFRRNSRGQFTEKPTKETNKKSEAEIEAENEKWIKKFSSPIHTNNITLISASTIEKQIRKAKKKGMSDEEIARFGDPNDIDNVKRAIWVRDRMNDEKITEDEITKYADYNDFDQVKKAINIFTEKKRKGITDEMIAKYTTSNDVYKVAEAVDEVIKDRKEAKAKRVNRKALTELGRKTFNMKRFERDLKKIEEEDSPYHEKRDKSLKKFESLRKKIIKNSGVSKKEAKAMAKTLDYSTLDRQTAKEVEESATDFFYLVGDQDRVKQIKVFLQTSSRAYADFSGNINIGSTGDKYTIFHEMGHHIELSEPMYYDASTEFIESKKTGKKEKLKILANPSYRDDEVAYPDHFVNPYVGKLNAKNKAEEVISMGLEHFADAENMRYLYENDPEHFFFILGVLTNQD